MRKTLNKVDTEGIYLNIINVLYDKPKANNILYEKKRKTFPLTSRTRQGCPLLLFSIFQPQQSDKTKHKRNPNWKRRKNCHCFHMT